MSGLDRLIADVPNGQPFFSTRLGGGLTLSFAEAARWIVHAQAFDPSGIKSGAEGDPRVKGGKGYPIGTGWSGFLGGVLPEGPTLKDTLLLNLIARDYGATARDPGADRPAWERDPVGPAEEEPGGRAPTGPVDLYTWQSRRIRLAHDRTQVTHVLICNGERSTPQNKHAVEPHSGWRRSKAQEKKLGAPLVYMPREHDAERAVWRGLQSLLPGAVKPQGNDAATFLAPPVLNWISSVSEDIGLDYPVRLHTLGMTYGSQSSTTEEIIDDVLPLRAVLLRQDAVDLVGIAVACAKAADDAAYAVGKLAGDLAAAGGCGRDEREGPITRAKESALAALDPPFRAWLRALGPDTDATAAQSRWHETADDIVRALGKVLVARAPVSAWSGRVVDQRLLTSAHADRNFQWKVRDVLPYAYPELVS
jgi:CRISPR system Cascade subunit CasA